MRARIDITNQKFTRLTAIKPSPAKGRGFWECMCECGTTFYCDSFKLRNNNTKSCGCFKKNHCSSIGKLRKINPFTIDWSNPDWCYLLGMIHGDGHIRKGQVTTSIAFSDESYANVLSEVWKSKGFNPKIDKATNSLTVTVHSVSLSEQLQKFKLNGIWFYPEQFLSFGDKAAYLAGVFDTDGTIPVDHSSKDKNLYRKVPYPSISQKANGNLEQILPFFDQLNIKFKFYTFNGKYKNSPYPVDFIYFCKSSEILKFCELIPLRHPRKAAIIVNVKAHVKTITKGILLHTRLQFLLITSPQSSKEAMIKLGINLNAFYSAITRLRKTQAIKRSLCSDNVWRYSFID